MSISMLFLCGLGITGLSSVAVVLYLHGPLRKLLVELCGNEGRAEFWTAFSAVTVGVVPVIFSLASQPSVSPGRPALLQVADQFEWGLIGMVVSVLLLGWIIARFIPRAAPKA